MNAEADGEVFLGFLPTEALEEDAPSSQDVQLIPTLQLIPVTFPSVKAAPVLARIATADKAYHFLLTPPDVKQWCFAERPGRGEEQRVCHLGNPCIACWMRTWQH